VRTKTVFKASFTGAQFKTLWEEVQANLARLRSCGRHRFPPLTGEFPKKYRCEFCGGEAGVDYVTAYAAGFKAAGGDPKDVCSNIDGEAA
jgi:hypothetical protein